MDDENRQASSQEERELADYLESVARALHEAHAPYCAYSYPFEHPLGGAAMYRELARATMLVAPSR